jgi:hypothetical protein
LGGPSVSPVELLGLSVGVLEELGEVVDGSRMASRGADIRRNRLTDRNL